MAHFITLTIAAMVVLAISVQSKPVNVKEVPDDVNLVPVTAQDLSYVHARRDEPMSGSKSTGGDKPAHPEEKYHGEHGKKITSSETHSKPKGETNPGRKQASGAKSADPEDSESDENPTSTHVPVITTGREVVKGDNQDSATSLSMPADPKGVKGGGEPEVHASGEQVDPEDLEGDEEPGAPTAGKPADPEDAESDGEPNDSPDSTQAED